MRFNQPFGDTVDWDLIPDIAIDQINLVGSNPVFGLNALGGAVNVQLKNGFTCHGVEVDLSGGSFGQVKAEFQYGKQRRQHLRLCRRRTILHQGGWRDLQSSDIQNFYGDFGWRGDSAEVHLNITGAHSVLNGPGTSPVELLAADPQRPIHRPEPDQQPLSGDQHERQLRHLRHHIGAGGRLLRYFLQRVTNGNAPNDTPCDDGSGLLCSDPGVISTTLGGASIPDFLERRPPIPSWTTRPPTPMPTAPPRRSPTAADMFGLQQPSRCRRQLRWRADPVRRHLLSSAASTAVSRVFIGPGVVIDEPGQNVAGRRRDHAMPTYGVFFADTL